MLQRLASPFREFGFWAGVLYVIGRGLNAISPRLNLYVYELLAQPIPDADLLPARVAHAIDLRRINRGDPEVALMPARPDIKESRFAQGAICLGAFRKDRLVGYVWLAFGAYDEDEVRCTFLLVPPEQVVFDFDFYILPEHRMGRAFVAIWNAVNHDLRDRGVRWTCSRITRFNVASRSAHARLGSQRIGRTMFFQAWALETMVATVPPYLYVSWSPRQRVALKLEPARASTQASHSTGPG